MKTFKNGLLTGLVLQIGTIGPVFFFIINLALQKPIQDGIAAVAAVTIVDYLYILLAIFGVGKLLEKKKVKKAFGIISSSVLILFGIFIIKNAINEGVLISNNSSTTNLLSSFSSVFFLTITSPLTIVMWTSLFGAKALEYNYTKRDLLAFGLSVGLATPIFLGGSTILLSLLGKTIPVLLIQGLNITIGILLVVYGGTRLLKALRSH